MADVVPYYTFLREHVPLTRDEFLSRVTVPHLYFLNLPELEDEETFTTMRVVPGQTPGDLGQQGIVGIRKSGGSNAFQMMVTMGRAKNNDLVIPDHRVSKFHAYFRELDGRWTVTDANSTNGTLVDGVALASQQSVEVESGATLELSGALHVWFLSPEDLYGQVQGASAWVQ